MGKFFATIVASLLALGTDSSIALPGAKLSSTALPGTVTALGSPVTARPVAALELASGSTVFFNTCASITENYFDLCAIRLLPDGQRDLQFGIGGFALLPRQNANTVVATAIMASNGDYLVLARDCGASLCIARMRPDGSLNSGFGSNGWVDIANVNDLGLARILEDSSGRILVVSWCAPDANNQRFCVDRMNADGSPDLIFSPSGRRSYSVTATESLAEAALDSSDRIVLVGSGCADQFNVSCVRRLTSSGSIDTTWSPSGSKPVFLNGLTGAATAIAFDDQGRYLIGGACQNLNDNVCVVRFNPVTGARDLQFGNQGQSLIEVAAQPQIGLRASGNGDILVTGTSQSQSPRSGYLFRLSPSGAAQFPYPGYRTFPLQDGQVPIQHFASGRILVAGSAYSNVGFTASRFLDSDASVDRSFDHGGRGFAVSGDTYIDMIPPVVAGAPGGGWFALAACSHMRVLDNSAQHAACLVKHTATGAQDPSFGINLGWAYVPSPASGDLLAISADVDGRPLILGNCEDMQSGGTSRRCLVRLTVIGQIDASFGAAGKAMLDASIIHRATAIATDTSGRILVSGICVEGGAYLPCVMRLLHQGTLDTGFGAGGIALVRNLPTWHEHSANVMSSVWNGKLIALADGRVLIAGNCSNLSRNSVCLSMLTVAGGADANFGEAGVSVLGPATLPDHLRAIDASGSGFVVASDCQGYRACITRVLSNGDVDVNAFAAAPPAMVQNARLLLDSQPNAPAAQSIQSQADGKILVGGPCQVDQDQICLLRVHGDGAKDLAFGTSGALQLRIGNGRESLGGLLADRDGAIVAVARCIDPLGGQHPLAATSEPCHARLVANSAGFFDVDDDDRIGAGNDGMMVVRHMLGIRGNGLVANVVGQGAARTLAADVSAYLSTSSPIYPQCSTNIVGSPDGPVATLDGLILLRAMLGLTGSAVTNGLNFPAQALRTSWADLRTHLNTNCGMSFN